MRLVPGPIPPFDFTWYDSNVYDPGFTQLEGETESELPALEAAMDVLLNPAALILPELPDDGLDPSLDNTDLILADLAGSDYGTPGTVIDSNFNVMAEAMGNAFAITPAEAWQIVPPAMIAPGVPGPPPGENPSTEAIFNLTRPGATDFNVGDNYQINVVIPPLVGGGGIYAGVTITMYPWVDNVPRPMLPRPRRSAPPARVLRRATRRRIRSASGSCPRRCPRRRAPPHP